MKTSTPIRIADELYAAAARVAPMASRTTTQQIVHWARIGRELEASPEISVEDIARMLRGAQDYDALDPKEQAIARACWKDRMAILSAALRLDRSFAAEGRPYAELDEQGAVVVHEPQAARSWVRES